MQKNNCTDFGKQAANIAGIDLSQYGTGAWAVPAPGGLPLLQVGNNPADLGQDISEHRAEIAKQSGGKVTVSWDSYAHDESNSTTGKSGYDAYQ